MPLLDQPIAHLQASLKSVSGILDRHAKKPIIQNTGTTAGFSRLPLPVHLSKIPRTKRSAQPAPKHSNPLLPFTQLPPIRNPTRKSHHGG